MDHFVGRFAVQSESHFFRPDFFLVHNSLGLNATHFQRENEKQSIVFNLYLDRELGRPLIEIIFCRSKC